MAPWEPYFLSINFTVIPHLGFLYEVILCEPMIQHRRERLKNVLRQPILAFIFRLEFTASIGEAMSCR